MSVFLSVCGSVPPFPWQVTTKGNSLNLTPNITSFHYYVQKKKICAAAPPLNKILFLGISNNLAAALPVYTPNKKISLINLYKTPHFGTHKLQYILLYEGEGEGEDEGDGEGEG